MYLLPVLIGSLRSESVSVVIGHLWFGINLRHVYFFRKTKVSEDLNDLAVFVINDDELNCILQVCSD